MAQCICLADGVSKISALAFKWQDHSTCFMYIKFWLYQQNQRTYLTLLAPEIISTLENSRVVEVKENRQNLPFTGILIFFFVSVTLHTFLLWNRVSNLGLEPKSPKIQVFKKFLIRFHVGPEGEDSWAMDVLFGTTGDRKYVEIVNHHLWVQHEFWCETLKTCLRISAFISNLSICFKTKYCEFSRNTNKSVKCTSSTAKYRKISTLWEWSDFCPSTMPSF